MKITRDMVEFLLANEPATRENDELLLAGIFRRYSIYIFDIAIMSSCNNIKRRRAYFNHKWLYLPTDEKVKRHRHLMEDKCREDFRPKFYSEPNGW